MDSSFRFRAHRVYDAPGPHKNPKNLRRHASPPPRPLLCASKRSSGIRRMFEGMALRNRQETVRPPRAEHKLTHLPETWAARARAKSSLANSTSGTRNGEVDRPTPFHARSDDAVPLDFRIVPRSRPG